jgi:pyridoxine kinase
LQKLTALCAKTMITGVANDNQIAVYYTDEKGNLSTYSNENVEGFFCGAGDVFASAFVGCLAKGKTQTEAIALSSDFAAAAIRRSAIEVPDRRYGLNFEAEIFPFLKKLNG